MNASKFILPYEPKSDIIRTEMCEKFDRSKRLRAFTSKNKKIKENKMHFVLLKNCFIYFRYFYVSSIIFLPVTTIYIYIYIILNREIVTKN